jgi:hypothetical protein
VERLLAVPGLDDAVAGSAEPVGDQLADVLLVIGDQDGGRPGLRLGNRVTSAPTCSGISTTTLVPLPPESAIRIVPPCASAMALLMARPSPDPAVPVAVDAR